MASSIIDRTAIMADADPNKERNSADSSMLVSETCSNKFVDCCNDLLPK